MSKHSTQMATLATLLDLLAEAPTLPEARRRETAAAVRTFCKVLNTEPHLVEANAPNLQRLLAKALPAACNVTATRWRNVTSLMRGGLTLMNPHAFPARMKTKRLSSWAALFELSEAKPVRRGLSRFSRWCSLQGIEPADVSDEVLVRFGDDLAANCVHRNVGEVQNAAGKAWNLASATVPGWPAVTLRIPDRRKNPSLPWTAFPDTLVADVETYLTACANEGDDLDSEFESLRPATIITKRTLLRGIATAMVESGVAPGDLGSLADMIVPERVRAAVEVLRQRAGTKTTGRIHNVTQLLIGVARHYVHANPAAIAGLARYRKKLKPKHTGMTLKNRERLAQFDVQGQLDRFMFLPEQLMAAALRIKNPTATEALVAQDALLLAILQYVPIRIGNVAVLEMGKSLIVSGQTGRIVLGREEVKNKVDLDWPLSSHVVGLIQVYLKRFHPLVSPPGCPMLFSSRSGGHKDPSVLGRQVTKRVRNEIGIEFNAHLARHLAAKLMLDLQPGAYGIIKQVLSHKQIQTTIDAYCGTEDQAAFNLYTAMVDKRRDAVGGGAR